MTDIDAMCANLNQQECCKSMGGPGVHPPGCGECPRDIAAALERMRDDSTALRARLAEVEAKWRDEYVNATVERERLAEVEAALRPFAEAEEHLSEPERMPDSNSCIFFGALGLNAGHIRRASAALVPEQSMPSVGPGAGTDKISHVPAPTGEAQDDE